MTPAMTALEAAITEAGRLEKVLKDGRPRVQVTLSDERASAKATALAWFEHKPPILSVMAELIQQSSIKDISKYWSLPTVLEHAQNISQY